jgi:hypothetical protein
MASKTNRQTFEAADVNDHIPTKDNPIVHGEVILVVEGGWVFQGYATEIDDRVILTDSCTIIKWGTDAGLEQLGGEGPRESTTLGVRTPLRMVPRDKVTFAVYCDAKAWAR